MKQGYYYEDRQPDRQYADLIRRVLKEGDRKVSKFKDRPDNIGISGSMMRFDLRNGYPLIIERRIGTKKSIAEMCWMLSGSTNTKDLAAMGFHVWDAWGTQEMTAKFGREEGDLGPLYGHQWRSFAGEIDQIKLVLEGLRRDPDGKQHRVIAWNPAEFFDQDGTIKVRPLTCHGDFQLTHANGFLDMCMTQRSGDILIGVPFNMAFYAALLHLFAHTLGMTPRYFTHYINDVHVYVDQLDVVDGSGAKLIDTLLAREPRPYPTIEVADRLENLQDLDDFFSVKPDDLTVVGYTPHSKLDFPVAI